MADLSDAIKQLDNVDATLEKIRADEALINRISRLADLLKKRVAAGDFNCICTGASREQTLSR